MRPAGGFSRAFKRLATSSPSSRLRFLSETDVVLQVPLRFADFAASMCGVNISPWVLAKLDAALVPEPGLRVVEFRVDRRRNRELHTRLRGSVAAALA
jgi:hypothetical protein